MITKKTIFLMNMEQSVVEKKTEAPLNVLDVQIVLRSVFNNALLPTTWGTGLIIVLRGIDFPPQQTGKLLD